MLAHSKEGKLSLEDGDGSVVLDLTRMVRFHALTSRPASDLVNQDEPGEGLFTEGCFALVEGEYTDDGTLEVIAVGQPPCEKREVTRYFPHLYSALFFPEKC